mgnify:CR=1 FL=1
MTPDEKHAHARSFPIHVGVDTAKTFHVLVAQGPDGQRSKPVRVDVSRAGFAATDAHLREALVPWTSDATVVIVGQRVASIRTADQILVLEDGEQVGLGTHDQLIETCPTYLEIVESQRVEEPA